jgi:hypothetical protein
MKELKSLAEEFKSHLAIQYDSEGVKYLEGFIERTKVHIPREEWPGLINACAAFFGECIIANFGGEWIKEEDGHLAVGFNDINKVYPFSKVRKQFENGLEDSIHSLYTLIPAAFKLEPKVKKKWWQF